MMCRGLIELALREQHVAEIVVRFGITGPKSNRLLVTCGCVVELALALQDIAEVVVGVGVVGLKGDRLLILGGGLAQAVLVPEDDAEVVMRVGVVRFEGDGTLKSCGGLVELALVSRSKLPRLLCASAKPGLRTALAEYWATASSSLPWFLRTTPRLRCNSATSGQWASIVR